MGVGLCGVFSQMLSSALYGVTTALPRFMSANMAGQAVGGLIPALIVVATGLAASKSSGDFDDDDDGGCAKVAVDAGAVGYFLAAAALFAVSVAAFRFLERSELYGAAQNPASASRSFRKAPRDEHVRVSFPPETSSRLSLSLSLSLSPP